MRVTNNMKIRMMAESIFRQSETLLNTQKKIATGKKIQQPSDDPVGMKKVLDYRRSLSSIDQYLDNIAVGKLRMEYNETVLDQASKVLNQAANIAANESGGAFDTRPTSAGQVKHLREQLVDVANSKFGEDYMYAGHQTDMAPYAHLVQIDAGVAADIAFGLAVDATDAVVEIRNAAGQVVRTINLGDGITPGSGGTAGVNTVAWNGLDDSSAALPDGVYQFSVTAGDAGSSVVTYETYNGDAGDVYLILGDSLNMKINSDGPATFNDVFHQLSLLQQGLENSDLTAGSNQINATVVPLEGAADRVELVRSNGAVNHNRLAATENQYGALKVKMQDMLAATEDTDLAQAIVELQNLETTYQATLATAARLLQPSLIDFLR